jgi:tol-pal system protein YbgF
VKLRTFLLLACCLHTPAWAADKELTRQMIEFQSEARIQGSRIDKLEASLQKNEQLLSLLKEVEALKAEISQLRGDAEVQTHHLETLEKRQKDLYVDLDSRVSDLSKAAAAAPAPTITAVAAPTTPSADPVHESADYEAALNAFKSHNYTNAIKGFRGFLKTYPDSTLAPNAQYWIGYSYYALKDYKTALAQQQKLIAVYPTSPKIPDALLNIASNQMELKDRAGAKKTLEEIITKYGASNAASLAAKRLASLK